MKFQISNNAQISLELILITAAFFSFLLLFLPLIQKTLFLGLFALDVSNAKAFCNSVEVSARELNSMSSGSKITLTAKPLNEWIIKSDKNKFFLAVYSENYNKEKIFSFDSFNLFFDEFSFSEETVFVLTKTEKLVLLEIQKA